MFRLGSEAMNLQDLVEVHGQQTHLVQRLWPACAIPKVPILGIKMCLLH